MAKDWRTLKLEILAETKEFVKDMDKSKKEVDSFGDRATKMGKVAAAAFAAAAAAAAAYAAKLAIDGVKAAIEDEAAQLRLAKALQNVTGATEKQISAIEDQISKMSLAYGIADDELRPAFQRLATATGSLEKANDGLALALDISAGTGKSVEAVSNALAKAYEGNTSALGRLGIGLSTAEIKSLGLDRTMAQLADTFGGQATVKANTLEGQIQRLKVGFDEAKESVGAALLPMVQKLMDYFVNTVIPKFQEAKQKAVDPIITAFKNNEDALRSLWSFIRTYLVPIFETTLVNAIEGVGKIIGGVLNIVGRVVRGIEDLINGAIEGINKLIGAWNAVPDWAKPGGDIRPIPRVNFGGTSRNQAPALPTTINLPGSGGTVVIPPPATPRPVPTPPVATVPAPRSTTPSGSRPAPAAAVATVTSGIGVGATIADFEAVWGGDFNIFVQAPSAIDEEGFQRAVVNALNEASNRGTGGGGAIGAIGVL